MDTQRPLGGYRAKVPEGASQEEIHQAIRKVHEQHPNAGIVGVEFVKADQLPQIQELFAKENNTGQS